MKKLWIAEKPVLGSAIAKALGIISRADGHIICKNNKTCFLLYNKRKIKIRK